MALGHNDTYERGAEVRRKMREKEEKLGGRNLQRFYKKNKIWPQFCEVVGSCANFFI
jgi:hypothetical protein